jgi:ABC-type transport system involved in cytochrome c biogenesis ATPase subunit
MTALAQAHLKQGGMIIAASHEALPFAAHEITLGA